MKNYLQNYSKILVLGYSNLANKTIVAERSEKNAKLFIFATKRSMVRRTKTTENTKNPFRFKTGEKGKTSGKRIGKSKPEKANNQLNRRVK